jgi:hypothetical protein
MNEIMRKRKSLPYIWSSEKTEGRAEDHCVS